MKKLLVLFFMLGAGFGSFAQSKVQEKDILGEWELVIDLDMRDIEDEVDDDNWLAARFAKSIGNFVLDVIDEIDITLDFRRNGEVKITVDVFGEHEVEYSDWRINKEGQLVIEDFDSNRRGRRSYSRRDSRDDDVWMFDGRRLFAYEKGYRDRLKRKDVFLVRN